MKETSEYTRRCAAAYHLSEVMGLVAGRDTAIDGFREAQRFPWNQCRPDKPAEVTDTS